MRIGKGVENMVTQGEEIAGSGKTAVGYFLAEKCSVMDLISVQILVQGHL